MSFVIRFASKLRKQQFFVCLDLFQFGVWKVNLTSFGSSEQRFVYVWRIFFPFSKYWLKICLSRECVNKSFAVFNKYGKTFSLNISFMYFHFFFPKISYEQLDRFSVSTKQSSSRGCVGSRQIGCPKLVPFGFNDNENNFCHKACLHLSFVRIVNLIFLLLFLLVWFPTVSWRMSFSERARKIFLQSLLL